MILSKKESVKEIRCLFEAILPVPFPSSFYNSLVTDIFVLEFREHNQLVGAICWREMDATLEGAYIYALAVEARCRNEGIGSSLLKRLLSTLPLNSACYLHVHTGNTEAIQFYNRFGFKHQATISGMYPRLKPNTDGILMKWSGL